MSRFRKVDLAYSFLVEKEKAGESFTIDQLANFTGWKEQSCRTYPSKNWHNYVTRDGNQYSTSGITFLSKDEFRKVHSQKAPQLNNFSMKAILLKKAKEFALLAVATYNNPFTDFKTYGFIVNIIIAYTALFHAIFEKREEDYFYLDLDGNYKLIDGDKKAWELTECFNKYWVNVENAEKANLKFLIELRNKIEHRSLPAIDLLTSGECQSALNNFENLIVKEFGDEYALITSLAMAMQLTEISAQAQVDALKQLQTDNYRVIREYMETYRNGLSDEISQSQKYRLRAYLIPKLGNHASTSNLAIEFINTNNLSEEALEDYEKAVTFIKEIEFPFKLRPNKVVKIIEKKIIGFNMTLHTKCWKYFQARPRELQQAFRGEFVAYDEGAECYLYSQKWVKFLEEKLSDANILNLVKGQPI
ncbi:DUF3644 domain-containing protein [Serratia fonticola]|uniref:DUF3644 domain-containing protein n=1 Tax=Serratia fonticola TaxID=47917 RepID=UPI0021778506|nr:DUF3644 domain-containing protein [Serratia fonticola]CAI2025462.1 Protein of uncharacterised function (DUF3644) [Serratia fonticola]